MVVGLDKTAAATGDWNVYPWDGQALCVVICVHRPTGFNNDPIYNQKANYALLRIHKRL